MVPIRPGLVEGHLIFFESAVSAGDFGVITEWIKENSSTEPVVINSFFEAEKEFIRGCIALGDFDTVESLLNAVDGKQFDENNLRYKKLKLNQCKVLADGIKVAKRFLQGNDDMCKGLSDLLKAKQDEVKSLDLEEREKNFRDKPLSTSINETLTSINEALAGSK